MGFIKYALIAAVTVYAIKHATERTKYGKLVKDDLKGKFSDYYKALNATFKRYRQDYSQTHWLY